MNVEWRDINPDYSVSSDGEVGSRRRGKFRVMKPRDNGWGYSAVKICTDSGKRSVLIHRLVAEAFIGPPPTPLHSINHKNGIRADNRVGNLEWVTRSENNHHAYSVLGHKAARGEAHGHVKLTEANVREIRRRAGEGKTPLGREFGVSPITIYEIVSRRTWTWLPDSTGEVLHG